MAKIIKGLFPASEKDEESEKKPAPLYQLSISLTYSDPLIWRRFQVPGECRLSQLHEIIAVLLGWSGVDAHQFYVGKIFYDMAAPKGCKKSLKRFDESKFSLQDIEESMKWCFLYLYDAGEGWEHELELEEILPADQGSGYPVLLSGDRSGPPEYFNDIHEFEDCLSSLKKMENGFDPSALDIEAINLRLKEITIS
jgi:hypothetical protein